MKISLQELSKFITTNTYNHPESKKLLAESFIQNEKWDEARNTIKSLLEHKPDPNTVRPHSHILHMFPQNI